MEKEKKKKKRYNFTLSDKAVENLEKLSVEYGLSKSGVLEFILYNFGKGDLGKIAQ